MIFFSNLSFLVHFFLSPPRFPSVFFFYSPIVYIFLCFYSIFKSIFSFRTMAYLLSLITSYFFPTFLILFKYTFPVSLRYLFHSFVYFLSSCFFFFFCLAGTRFAFHFLKPFCLFSNSSLRRPSSLSSF